MEKISNQKIYRIIVEMAKVVPSEMTESFAYIYIKIVNSLCVSFVPFATALMLNWAKQFLQ